MNEMDNENIKSECGTILRTKENTLSFLCLHCRIEFLTISAFVDHYEQINGCNDDSACSSPVEFEFKDVQETYPSTEPTVNSNLRISKRIRKKSSKTSISKGWLHTWTCDICFETKSTNGAVKESVKRHMKQFHNAKCELKKKAKPHQCDICSKRFRLAQFLSDHMAVHLGETPYQCPHCKYKSASKASMYRHNRIYHNNYDAHKYICDKCGMKFQTAQNLASHTNSHLGLKPYSCDECGKEFANKNYVKVHKRYHLDHRLRPFKCNECDQSFVLNSHLIRHNREHAGTLKNIECHYCEKKFDSQSKLREHVNVHLMVREFSCDKCNKKFSRLRAMKYHLKRVHGDGESI